MAKIDVDKVLQQMNDQEKVSLLAGVDFWHTKSLPKYGIPALRLSDGPNGVRGTHFFNSVPAACFPCGTALGATFDQELLYEAGQLMADEAKAKGAHVLLGPTINMQRSPLGGRGFESYSEDPVLAGLAAAAVIKGIQSHGIAATPKHFVCNDQEHERNRVNSIVTERALRELYLLPFQLAIRDSAPKALMTAYNKVNGIHASENKKLLADILRGEWGWKGLVMSDWFGTYSTSEALNAGLDLEMPGPTHWRGPAAVLAASTYKLGATTLDDRTRSVLDLVNYAEGSGVPENAPEGGLDTPETAALLRRIAADSVVLLKNEGNVLPLDKSKKTLVIGPNASIASYCGGGSASLNPYHAVTPLAAITDKVGSESVVYTVGAYAHKDLPDLGPSLFRSPEAKTAGVTFQTYNEPPEAGGDRKLLDKLQLETTNMMFMDYNNPDMGELWYADIDGYLVADRSSDYEFGMCVYGSAQLFVDGQLLIDVTDKQTQGTAFFGCGTIEEHGVIALEKGKTYHVQVRFGSAPTSKLTPQAVSFGGGAVKIGGAWKIDAAQEVAHAAELAGQYDQVVLCLGLNKDWESEGFDRPDMKLPPGLDELAAAVLAANPRTAIVVQSGTPVEMPWLPQTAALLQAWYGGNETGHGIADVLFGDVNPSAKLPLSFPAKVEHNPAYLHYRSEAGRVLYGEDVYMGYRYYDTVGVPVAFPFGHGLSYTTFALSGLAVEAKEEDGVLAASVRVANTGARDGAEVLQLYVSQHSPSIRRPVKELKDFKKVAVAAGAAKDVAFSVPLKYACSYYDERREQWICEKGTYTVYVAASSQLEKDAFVEATFEVPATFWWSGL